MQAEVTHGTVAPQLRNWSSEAASEGYGLSALRHSQWVKKKKKQEVRVQSRRVLPGTHLFSWWINQEMPIQALDFLQQ